MLANIRDYIHNTSFFYITYEWVKYARVLYYTGMERIARDKHSCLLDPFISEENEAL